MTKNEKLMILEKLIERAEKATYTTSSEMTKCIDDVKSFLWNAMPKDNGWEKRIDSILWYVVSIVDRSETKSVKTWEKGKEEFIGVLNSIKTEVELFSDDKNIKDEKIKTDKIFIVHGHNEVMKLAVQNVIFKLGLKPIILHEQPNSGRTIIEKFEKLSNDVGFAVVLLSADDKMENGEHRARQNVILELGYFIAKLGRENVVALYDNSCEIDIPSDISGILWEPYDNPAGVWQYEIVQELIESGFNVDANRLT